MLAYYFYKEGCFMAKANQIGRSMVEMLGVLAIIGVLSVGSISGYSKAMLKHKMNKQAEQLNTVFNLASRYNKQIRFDDSTSHSVVEMFIKLGELPKEMLKKNVTTSIYDVFQNKLDINVYGQKYETGESWNPAGATIVGIALASSENDANISICRNVINVAKENKDSIWYLETIGTGDSRVQTTYYGDNHCTTNCIATLTLSKIDAMCRGFVEKNIATMRFNVWWK